MKKLNVIIVYYSFSGNTRKIARAIHEGVSQKAGESRIVAIKGSFGIPTMKHKDLLEYDLIGFGSPVWFEGPTPNIMTFIEKLPSLKGKHTFVFFTHGTMPCDCLRWMVRNLQKKRSIVVGWKDWYGSCYPADIFKPYHTDGLPDEIDFKEAIEFGKNMVIHSRRIYEGETDLVPKLMSRTEYDKLYGRKTVLPDSAERSFRDIKVNREKCNMCLLCEVNCPTGSMHLSLDPPINTNTCVGCWVCEQICPVGAVEVDFDAIIEEVEPIWGRTWEHLDFFQKATRRTKADPRFRPHVKHEDVGKDGYWFQLSKHPRVKIPK